LLDRLAVAGQLSKVFRGRPLSLEPAPSEVWTVSEDIREKERLRSLEVLTDVLNEFLEGRYDKFSITFDRPLELTENEYYELLGNYDSSNGAKLFDMFTYDIDTIEDPRTEKCFRIAKKLEIEREIEEAGIYVIYRIVGYTDEIEIDCNNEEGQRPAGEAEENRTSSSGGPGP